MPIILTTLIILLALISLIAFFWVRSGRIPEPEKLPEGVWGNWACNQRAKPEQIAQPKSSEELQELIARHDQGVRVVGAGHSFTELVPSSSLIVNLDKMAEEQPVIFADPDRNVARINAGARLRDLSPALAEHDLAFKNLGDINVQSFAGATATATHGTGKTFPCLSAEIQGVSILAADGSVVSATMHDNPELVLASQVSLGALGVLLECDVSAQEKYSLHRKVWIERTEDALQKAHQMWEQHRNFEFFYIPYSGHCACISHDETTEPDTPREESEDEQVLMSIKQVRDFFSWYPALRRFITTTAVKGAKTEEAIGESWKLLANERTVRFSEMEYHLPPENALDVLRKVIHYLEYERTDAFFPIEVRQTAGDNAFLSPFQNGPRISIAVHAYYKERNDYFFTHIEKVFLEYGGRPHWGKLHSLEAKQLSDLYPDFNRFQSIREKMDPQGKFMTPYMRRLLDA